MAPLGGAHERAAHDDSFAARRDVRELLFDMSFVDGVITLEDALALRGATLHDRDVAAGRTGPQRRFLVPTGRGHNCILRFVKRYAQQDNQSALLRQVMRKAARKETRDARDTCTVSETVLDASGRSQDDSHAIAG